MFATIVNLKIEEYLRIKDELWIKKKNHSFIFAPEFSGGKGEEFVPLLLKRKEIPNLPPRGLILTSDGAKP
ncbi:MAG: hypothetical protein QNJ32_02555 [Xenococcaceae cyanobacterium MO_167.B27]|nr:hypothetical protein [Xenococcaceae cyanobacterium MO_167.B27]